MKNFSKNDWNHMQSCILHATWETTKKQSTKEELIEIFKELPDELKCEAKEYGMSDTVWREHFIEWYEENKL